MSRNDLLFKKQSKILSYNELLDRIQPYMSEQYRDIMVNANDNNKTQIMSYIRQYLTENDIGVENYMT